MLRHEPEPPFKKRSLCGDDAWIGNPVEVMTTSVIIVGRKKRDDVRFLRKIKFFFHIGMIQISKNRDGCLGNITESSGSPAAVVRVNRHIFAVGGQNQNQKYATCQQRNYAKTAYRITPKIEFAQTIWCQIIIHFFFLGKE